MKGVMCMELYNKYKEMMDNYGQHEIFMINYINLEANKHDVDFVYRFRDKFIALVKLGKTVRDRANVIVSHVDSPRLDVIVGNPFIVNKDGVFLKTVPYGGIIFQNWMDIPLVLVGRVWADEEIKYINTKGVYEFTITSLLPHLDGRKEMKDLKPDKLLVRIGDNKEEVLDFFESVCGITEKDFELADLSFVPSYNVKELGFDKDLIASYGHDDKSCAFASLQAFFDSGDTDVTKIVIFASYEETGSAQTTGCQSEIINDVFLELTDNVKSYRGMIRSSSVISADVCAGYESKYSSHFEECASAVVGKGVGIIPYLGQKRGNDTEFRFRNEIKELAIKNNIPYQIETTKTTEGGGGTVSTFFATKGCRVIDIGVPVLGMHSPQEVISKKDLKAMYDLFKAFYEN